MEKAREFILKIFKLVSKQEMRILPGQLAFFLVVSMIPILALIATLAAGLSISMNSVQQAIAQTIPGRLATIINSITNGNGINFNIIVFYVSAFVLASNGTYSMVNISNTIYKVKPNNIIKRRLKAIVMTLILVTLFIFLILVPVFGNTIINILKEVNETNTTLMIIYEMLTILKYPIMLIILFLNIKMMYVIAPDQEIPGNTTTKGAVFTTLGWIIATEIFSFYLEKFAKYDIFYGSISNVLVLLLWVYLLSYIFVFGMVINASDYKREQQ